MYIYIYVALSDRCVGQLRQQVKQNIVKAENIFRMTVVAASEVERCEGFNLCKRTNAAAGEAEHCEGPSSAEASGGSR